MDIVKELLKDIPLPQMVKIRQAFPAPEVKDVSATLRQILEQSGQLDRVRPGMRIALQSAVGASIRSRRWLALRCPS